MRCHRCNLELERGDLHVSIARSREELRALSAAFNGMVVTLCGRPLHRLEQPRLCQVCMMFLREYEEQTKCSVCLVLFTDAVKGEQR